VPDTRFTTSSGSAFSLSAEGFSLSELETGMDYWSSCPGYGTDIPLFQRSGGDVPISITRIDGRSPATVGGCGLSSISRSSGRITGGSVTIWTQETDGTSCVPLTDVIAHEFGHFLGLWDVEDAGCIGHIMGPRTAGGTRSVAGDDCQMADTMWLVPGEASLVSPVPISPTPPSSGGSGSPLVLDLDQGGFRFSAVRDGVRFDVDADGFAEATGWVEEGPEDGFLVLDRDGDGWIASGAELFGDHTFQPPSEAPNGFLALAVFDEPRAGGNGDGSIGPEDGVFPLLALWIDSSHDGLSQAGELHSLDSLGVTSISLRYIESWRRDRHGNQLRYKGTARVDGHASQVTDVFFLRE
jgi:hypothetical protein